MLSPSVGKTLSAGSSGGIVSDSAVSSVVPGSVQGSVGVSVSVCWSEPVGSPDSSACCVPVAEVSSPPFPVHPVTAQQPSNSRAIAGIKRNKRLAEYFILTILLFSAFIAYCVESANSIAYTHCTILFAICQCFCAILMQIVHSKKFALIRLYFQWIKKHAPNDCLGRTIYSRTQDTYDPIRVLRRATNRTSPSTHAEITSPIPTVRHR